MKTSKVHLLDFNVLIALATPEHSLNTRAAAWFRQGHLFATCPITQGALVRFHYRQVTDAYLVLLARKHGGSVATMDRALAAVHPGTTLLA